MKVNRSDFSEETFYIVECPKCACMIETVEDPAYIDQLVCDNCNEEINIED